MATVRRRTLAVVLMPALTLALAAWLAPAPAQTSQYNHVLSSGQFGLPGGARSVDWVVLNNSPDTQIVRVTVYQVRLGAAKTPVVPGAITRTLQPYTAMHNANSVGVGRPFTIGSIYEVVVEVNDRRVLPTVVVWDNLGGRVIPGTHLSPQDFTDIK